MVSVSAPASMSPARPDVHGRIARSGAVMLGASIVGAVANFALVALVGRGLGAAQTGLFFTAIGVATLVANTLRMGADTGLVRLLARMVAEGRHHELRPTLIVAVTPVAIIAGVASVAAIVFSGPLAESLFDPNDQDLGRTAIMVLAAITPLLAITTVLMAAARAVGRITEFAAVQNLALPIGRLVGVAVAIAVGASLVGVLSGWAAIAPLTAVSAVFIALAAVRRVAPAESPWTTPRGYRPLAREFWGFALPRGASALIETTLDWIDVILVAVLAGPSAAGIYAVATRCVKLVAMVDYATRVTFSTRISAALVNDRRDTVSTISRLGTRAMVTVAWPYCLTLAVFGTACMSVFGAEFASGGRVLTILAVGMMVVVATGSVQSILLLGGHSTQQLANKSIALAICVAGNLVATPRFGAEGAAVVWCIAMIVDAGLASWQVRHRMGIPFSLPSLSDTGLRALMCFVPVGVVAVIMTDRRLVALVCATAIGLGLYVVTVIRSGELRRMTSLIDEISQEHRNAEVPHG